MPIGEEHERRKVKNWTLLGILVGLALLFYAITIVKY